MRRSRIYSLLVSLLLFAVLSFVSVEKQCTLTVSVEHLENNKGTVQFSLYNKDGTVPDQYFKKYYKQLKSEISVNKASVTFENLPQGIYAVNVHHDEDNDAVIDKGWIFPTEGVGFSNLKSISPFNRPNFNKTKFELKTDKTIKVKIIYF